MIKPRNDIVLVKRLEEKYTGKLVLPEAHVEKPTLAVVVAVGPGRVNEQFPGIDRQVAGCCGDHPKTIVEPARITIDLEVGDVVFIGRYSGVEIEEKGEKLLFLREAEILGKRA